MVRPDRDLLHGEVEVDETYLTLTDRIDPISPIGRKSNTTKVLVVIAVEMLQPKGFGRIRIQRIEGGDHDNSYGGVWAIVKSTKKTKNHPVRIMKFSVFCWLL